jgi:uncharacterized protein YbaP (TraB family)
MHWLTRQVWLLLLCWAAGVTAAPGLWSVNDAQGRVRAYLFGTIHLCRADCFPLPGEVRWALERSDRLAVELDVADPQVITTVVAAGSLPQGQRLDALLPPELVHELAHAAERLQLPPESLQGMQPWFAGTVLVSTAAARAGYGADTGVDMALQGMARLAGKPLVSLESAERQVRAMAAGGEGAQREALRQTVDMVNSGEISAYLGRMIAAWRDGDGERLLALMGEGMDEKTAAPLMDDLLVARNREMAHRIDGLLGEPGILFVAIGSGHLFGRDSVPAELARLGWRVDRVVDR